MLNYKEIKEERPALAYRLMFTKKLQLKKDQHPNIHIVHNRLCVRKVFLKGLPSNQQVACILMYTTMFALRILLSIAKMTLVTDFS